MSEQMKKYVKSVRRRLNLPRDVKSRVISDFESSILARLEAGITEEAILSELGTPSKAAADLNEQMKEFTYRKSPWRFLFLAMAIYGGWKLLGGLWVNLVYLWIRAKTYVTTAEAASIGIIGGADGPTAIFLTTPVWVSYVIPVLLLIVGIWGFLRLQKCRQK